MIRFTVLLTDSPGYFSSCDTLDPISGLNHKIICANISINYLKHPGIKRKIWLYNQADFIMLNNLLSNYDWENIFINTHDIDLMAESFIEVVKHFASLCIPQKEIFIKPKDKHGMIPSVKKLFRECKR